MIRNTILVGDVLDRLRELPSESVHCVVTSPPYWGLRDYGVAGQIGLEATPELFVARMVSVFREVRRVLRSDGTCWVNLGDSYAQTTVRNRGGVNNSSRERWIDNEFSTFVSGLKPKDLCGIPWRVALALQADGWYLRSDIIWHKPNPMPESVTDRPTKSHEYLFLLTKSARYWYDADAVREDGEGYGRGTGPGAFRSAKYQNSESFDNDSSIGSNGAHGHSFSGGRNRRDVWTIATEAFPGAHFATFPRKLVEPCILAGCPAGGVVLDLFFGSGTVGVVALQHGRSYIGIELNPAYAEMARNRIEHGTVAPDQVEEEKAQGTLFDIHQADVI